jgi:hypothetical protein
VLSCDIVLNSGSRSISASASASVLPSNDLPLCAEDSRMPRVFTLVVAFLAAEADDGLLAFAISRSCHKPMLRPNAQHMKESNGRTIGRRAWPGRPMQRAPYRAGKSTKPG